METKILEDIGLTKAEIKVYLALLEEGVSSAGSILDKAEIHNSVFHFNINRLIEKGLVSYVKKGKVRVYQAADPDNFLTYLKDKETQVAKLLPTLKARQRFSKEKQEVEFFEGLKGIINLVNTLIADARSGDEFLFFPAEVGEDTKEIQDFYLQYDVKRREKGIITKGIASVKHKKIFESRKYLKMKYSSLPIPANQGICNNKMTIISWGEKPQGVLIHSKQMIAKQKEFFNALWESLS